MTADVFASTRDFSIVSKRRLEFMLELRRDTLFKVAGTAGSYYRQFDRRKKHGDGWRHIDNPTGPLKMIQSRLYKRFLARFPYPTYLSGGIVGRSTVDHGRGHVCQPTLVTLDLKDCFPSIDDKDVFFMYRDNLGCSSDIASLLTKLTTFQHRVPQGAPTSTALANMVLLPMHEEISVYCAKNGWEYSAFIDDIAISGPAAEQAIEPVIEIVRRRGMAVRSRKVERTPQRRSQAVTGVRVNRKISAGRRRVQALREQILAEADAEVPDPARIRSLWGRIRQVRSICAAQGRSLERLADGILPEPTVGYGQGSTDETRRCRGLFRQKH